MSEEAAARPGNLLANLPQNVPEELTEILASGSGLRVERIVSTGHRSPDGFWYDQPEREWVLLLQGAATLQFADPPESIDLIPGDHVDIAAHRRHRVESTSATEPTVWLAVFYQD
ncbi:phosphoribosylaminoimidazole carboxylase [Rosistilla oblonga]|uniref:phosphoribosylaminoimidazole carboxylase n=1 Tax=Rosistilla oblonga TaxID=2527990 RepID=UPI003A96C718